ncbi:MAG: SUMF1/EgtB/PvdO family nonheme iron enzyme [Anaerolineales bacterium]|jgi:formylglycine-generating enzyme required for sulfatase activity
MAKIFLSYSREDDGVMQRVKRNLERAGISVWTDEGLVPGTRDWEREIERNIRESKGVVVILSPDSYESEWVRREIAEADLNGIKIFPLLWRGKLTNAIPLRLKTTQFVNIHKDFHGGMENLLAEFRRLGWVVALGKGIEERKLTKKEGYKSLQKSSQEKSKLIWIGLTIILMFVLIWLGNSSIGDWKGESVIKKTEESHMPTTAKTATVTPSATKNLESTITQGYTYTSTYTILPSPTLGIGSTMISPVDGMVMVYVPAGEFEMGSVYSEDTKPVLTVYLDAFWIDKYEVTNQQFADFLNRWTNLKESGNSELAWDKGKGYILFDDGVWKPEPEYEDHPVVKVSWYEAQEYCEWAGRRLPTGAEWEKAARGMEECKYPWKDRYICEFANISYCDSTGTTPVGSYPEGVSPYGALDMVGNVWEWVENWYEYDYYKVSPFENPKGPSIGIVREYRGGSWNSSSLCSDRNGTRPNESSYQIGFRCAYSLP